MKNLDEKLQAMIDGERKNRSIAEEWLKKVTETLTDPCSKLLGNMSRYHGEECFAISIQTEDKNGVRLSHNVYFRYETHSGDRDREEPGFYLYHDGNYMLLWGNPLESVMGCDFWVAIGKIKRWLPIIEKDLDKKTESRLNLVESLLV